MLHPGLCFIHPYPAGEPYLGGPGHPGASTLTLSARPGHLGVHPGAPTLTLGAGPEHPGASTLTLSAGPEHPGVHPEVHTHPERWARPTGPAAAVATASCVFPAKALQINQTLLLKKT